MLAILPLLCWTLTFLITHGLKSRQEMDVNWRESILIATPIFGAFLLLIT